MPPERRAAPGGRVDRIAAVAHGPRGRGQRAPRHASCAQRLPACGTRLQRAVRGEDAPAASPARRRRALATGRDWFNPDQGRNLQYILCRVLWTAPPRRRGLSSIAEFPLANPIPFID